MLKLLFLMISAHLIHAQSEGVYCDNANYKNISNTKYEDLMVAEKKKLILYYQYSYQNCQFVSFNDEQFHFIMTITFQWEFIDLADQQQFSTFRPVVIASFDPLPISINDYNELYSFKLQYSTYFLDLQSINNLKFIFQGILLTQKFQQIPIFNSYELSTLYIGIYNFGLNKLSFKYSLTIDLDQQNCQNYCLDDNGYCQKGKCYCYIDKSGTDCSISVFTIKQNKETTFSLTPYTWAYLSVYENCILHCKYHNLAMKETQKLTIQTNYTWKDFELLYGSIQINGIDKKQSIQNQNQTLNSLYLPMSDSFGVSQTSAAYSYQDVNYPNFANSYWIIENGKRIFVTYLYQYNYTYIYQIDELIDDADKKYAYVLGLFNPNKNQINFNVVMISNASSSKSSDVNWVVQIVLYLLFFLFFLIFLALCSKFYRSSKVKQLIVIQLENCCCRQRQAAASILEETENFNFNPQQEENKSNQQNQIDQSRQHDSRQQEEFQQQAFNNNNRPLGYRHMVAKVLLETFMPGEKGMEIRQNYFWESNSPLDECFVCLQPILDSELCRITYCFHILHQNCLDQWLKNNNLKTCPYCRSQMNLAFFVQNYQDFNEQKQQKRIKKLKVIITESFNQEKWVSKYESEVSQIQSILSQASLENCFYSSIDQFDSEITIQRKELQKINNEMKIKQAFQKHDQIQEYHYSSKKNNQQIDIMHYESINRIIKSPKISEESSLKYFEIINEKEKQFEQLESLKSSNQKQAVKCISNQCQNSHQKPFEINEQAIQQLISVEKKLIKNDSGKFPSIKKPIIQDILLESNKFYDINAEQRLEASESIESLFKFNEFKDEEIVKSPKEGIQIMQKEIKQIDKEVNKQFQKLNENKLIKNPKQKKTEEKGNSKLSPQKQKKQQKLVQQPAIVEEINYIKEKKIKSDELTITISQKINQQFKGEIKSVFKSNQKKKTKK